MKSIGLNCFNRMTLDVTTESTNNSDIAMLSTKQLSTS